MLGYWTSGMTAFSSSIAEQIWDMKYRFKEANGVNIDLGVQDSWRNAEFAKDVVSAGLKFIGPSAASIELMGVKDTSNRLMAEAHIPVLPGYDGVKQNDKFLASEAEKIGFPVMIKAVAGGGGKGMRFVKLKHQFLDSLKSARSEALNAFGEEQPMLTAGALIPNVYDVNNGTASIIGLQTGAYLNSASAQLDTAFVSASQPTVMNPLGGYGMPNGTTANTIDGKYAYFHSGQVTLQINSIVASGNGGTVNDSVSPLCFRVLHVRAKPDAAGVTPSLSADLLRNLSNQNTGLMGSMTLRQLMTDFSVNRERFTVVHDKKFKLSEPVQPNYAGSSANQPIRNLPYPSQKTIKLWLDKPKKKLRFSEDDNGLTNAFEPLNYDFVNYIFVICCREQTTNGEYSSTVKRWTLTTQGQTKYRDC